MMSPASTSHRSFSSEEQRAFLNRMAQDDEFRGQLAAHPHEALAEYGLHLASEDVPEKIVLPTKEEVRSSLPNFEATSDEMIRWYGFVG